MPGFSYESRNKPVVPDLQKFQAAVSEGLKKDPTALEANNRLKSLAQMRDNHWNISREGETGIKQIIDTFSQKNENMMGKLATEFNSDMADRSDLYEAIILKAQAMLPEMAVKNLEDQLIQAKSVKNFQVHSKCMENLALLTQIWDNQIKALDKKPATDITEAEKYKKVKLNANVNNAKRVMSERAFA